MPDKRALVQQLQREILAMQGNGPAPAARRLVTGLGPLEAAFPGGAFPVGGVHEFLSARPEAAAATGGFIAGLLRAFEGVPGPCIWVSTRHRVFPPALAAFGLRPERVLFVEVTQAREALWAVEEALHCPAVAAVVGEIGDLDFTESRRLQLAVEESRVTGFIHRYRPRTAVTAAVARWQVGPLPSLPVDGLPGVGCPRWAVQLLKVRNGRPGAWSLEWGADGFRMLPAPVPAVRPARPGLAATG